ncbi:MAG TPA: hypothetical protein DCY13_11755, partial [Verrucomicrobiales bacterium]|nr:hypothetical protein [Verrucomicrobiales bacterium]
MGFRFSSIGRSRLGLSRTVKAHYVSQPDTFLTYVKQSGDPAPSGDRNPGDDYYGLDRFDRVQDQRWMKGTTDLERVKYGFDRVGNRDWRENTVATSGQDEFYTYNALYRLKTLDRGDLNGTYTGITGTPTWEEDLNFDPTGNWNGTSTGYLQKVNGTTTLNQNRTHNKVNEITDITETVGTAWPTPTQDAVGNLTKVPQPNSLGGSYDLKYDAWNRLVEVKVTNGSVVGMYAFDGLNRRISRTKGGNVWYQFFSD